MNSIYISVATVATAGVGLLATLFAWSRTRRTLQQAEKQTKESAKDIPVNPIAVDLLQGPQSRIDAAQPKALSALVAALEDTPNAVVQVGSELLIKSNGVVTVWSLTTKELRYLANHKQLLRDPESILSAINNPNTPFSSKAGQVVSSPG
jgi:hypothetical protein